MSYMKDAYAQILEAIPADLHGYRQFVCWRRGPERVGGKCAKIPVNPHTGRAASVINPDTWGTLEDAADGFLQYHADGVGFVLTDDDPFVVFDLDGVISIGGEGLDDGPLGDVAAFLTELDGKVFHSFSGTGLHVWVRGDWPESRGCRWNGHEVYTRRRFIALGTPWDSDPIPEVDLSQLEG